MTEHEFQHVDKQNWQLALLSKDPVKTYHELREKIETAMVPELEFDINSHEMADWYRAT